jgi:hypothetical protein
VLQRSLYLFVGIAAVLTSGCAVVLSVVLLLLPVAVAVWCFGRRHVRLMVLCLLCGFDVLVPATVMELGL